MQQPGLPSGLAQFGAIQSAAPSLGVTIDAMNVRDAAMIESAMAAFAREPNGGMIVTAGALPQRHRDLIIALAATAQTANTLFRTLICHCWGPRLVRS